MPNIEIDYSIYLPVPSVYYNYYEVLKSHNFVDNLEETNKLIHMFIEVMAEDIESLK